MDKKPEQLNPLDLALRRALPPKGFTPNQVDVTIEKISGFELFNTRPYHNYETWSDGYRVYGQGVDVKAEDLDDAIGAFLAALKQKGTSQS